MMMLRIGLGLAATLVAIAWMAPPAASGLVSGELFYRERVALPPDAVAEVSLLDVTRTDRPGELIAAVQIRPRQQVPIPFQIHFADPEIDPRRAYALRASIVAKGRLRFVAANLMPVLTHGHPERVRIELTAVSAGQAGAQELLHRTWLAEAFFGRSVPEGIQSRLSIGAEGEMVGWGGCNVIRGPVQVDGSSLAFGALATTRKMCSPAVMEQEARFLRALERTRAFRVEGHRLALVGADGTEQARFGELP